jgi:hypothetical protein
MKTNNAYMYIISAHFLSALANGDYSVLSDEESTLLHNWFKENNMEKSIWEFLPYGGTDLFKCEITGLMCETVEIHQHFFDESFI